ncbi:MarR family winged helix-turn-helix transcriptional regulator [Actinopolymorpha singaporensis]|uniref:DNA-binding transcriptional regulator, MarR family n=1 Tax=Actinopolymorpha singaporensis TaxID=117157 RepID=A0A1H1MIZ5_9ACTN|nr:MarR family transcriptional regulator [Actinopolymorpha singaporensis]SDR86592.1 DNA-binding transcriptional regulator, MarR family [Actinopolymorpha singaporensis]
MVPPAAADDRARKPARPPSGRQRPDPTEVSHWRPLHLLLAAMDDEIAALYAERGVTGIRPRFTRPLIRLGREGPMTIRALSDALGVSHSAMSQTVAALRREGFVRSTPGADARTREVAVTPRAREVLPFLEAEWRATERAVADLEAEIPYALSQVVRDLEAALARRSFRDRIAAHLDDGDGAP